MRTLIAIIFFTFILTSFAIASDERVSEPSYFSLAAQGDGGEYNKLVKEVHPFTPTVKEEHGKKNSDPTYLRLQKGSS